MLCRRRARLEIEEFKHEFGGKMNFYLPAVDDQPATRPTVPA